MVVKTVQLQQLLGVFCKKKQCSAAVKINIKWVVFEWFLKIFSVPNNNQKCFFFAKFIVFLHYNIELKLKLSVSNPWF